ncbi:hypothetical protein ACB040_13050 [Aeromonas sp. S11(2024)]|uniref:hypothetical protein n=1 Tax=unclassified Aeromonas TaxID=257493 RepID=UPI0035285D10
MMMKQTLEFFSGFPILLSPNSAAKLKKAKLDGRKKDIYKDHRGNTIEVSELTRDYHLYILASRTSSFFGTEAHWNSDKLIVSASLIFQTYPDRIEVPIELYFDGTSPYSLPSNLRPKEILSVAIEPPESGGFPMGMTFTHKDGSKYGFMLAPDLLHFIKYPNQYRELTDFHVEYVGIACGPNGNSNVFKRALAHEKVVEIQGDFQQRHGNKNLFIFAYDPGFLIHSQMPGGIVITGPGLIPNLIKGGMNSLFEAMEASLISYFQPEYNVEFKKFPLHRPNWLQGGFDSFDGLVLNVNRISVTLASDNSFNPEGQWSFGRFWNKTRPPQELHFVNIDVE